MYCQRKLCHYHGETASICWKAQLLKNTASAPPESIQMVQTRQEWVMKISASDAFDPTILYISRSIATDVVSPCHSMRPSRWHLILDIGYRVQVSLRHTTNFLVDLQNSIGVKHPKHSAASMPMLESTSWSHKAFRKPDPRISGP